MHARADIARRRTRASRERANATAGDDERERACESFEGTWTRDRTRNQHVAEYLIAHGVGMSAIEDARMTYEQTWTRASPLGTFVVHTTTASGIDRVLTYELGEFVEKYGKKSALFGDGPGEVKRRASFDAATRTHFVTTTSALGDETTTRVVDEDGKTMRVRRTFKRRDDPLVDIWCQEVFVKQSAK